MHRTATTTCRCGYATPMTMARCLGCGRRFRTCDREPVLRGPATVYRPVATVAPARPAAPVSAVVASSPPPTVGPLVVLALVGAAWLEPDAPRAELLTAAALVGATLAARPNRAVPAAAAVPVARAVQKRLSDAELRDAIAAW